MKHLREISDRFSVSLARPHVADFETLVAAGYTAVVNLDSSGHFSEQVSEQISEGPSKYSRDMSRPISPSNERDLASAVGLNYCHIPVNTRLGESQVDAFREWVSGVRGRILVYGDNSDYSTALTLMHIASEKGMSGKEALEQANKLGIHWREDELSQFAVHYVDTHSVDIHTV